MTFLRVLPLFLLFSGFCVAADVPAGDAANGMPKVQITYSKIGPRQIEDATARAIPRDYASAWRTLALGLEQNQTDQLDSYFVGTALDKFVAAVESQKSSGLRTRYIDHGHTVEAGFYSPDGGALELHDTARMEIQIIDGGNLIHTEQVTLHYVALMTPAADRWNVRLLESVPNF